MPCRHLGSRRAPTRHRSPRVLQGARPSGAHGRRAPPGALREKRWRKPGRRPETQTARDRAAPQTTGTWLLRRAHRALERKAVRRARRGRRIRGPRRRDRRPTRPRPGARRSANRRPRWWRRACAPRDGRPARRRSAVLVRQRATVPLNPGRADRRRQHCHEWRHHRLDRGCRAHRHRSPCWGQGRVPSSRGRDQRWGRRGRAPRHRERRGRRRSSGEGRQTGPRMDRRHRSPAALYRRCGRYRPRHYLQPDHQDRRHGGSRHRIRRVRPIRRDHCHRRRRRWRALPGAGRGPGEGPRRRWGRVRRSRRLPRGRAR